MTLLALYLPVAGLARSSADVAALPALGHREGEILSLCQRRLDKPTHLRGCGCGEAASAPASCSTREGRPVFHLLSLVLPSSVALALGALTLWHAALITRGETSIERHINRKERQRLQKKGKVSTAHSTGAGWGRARCDAPLPVLQIFRNPYSYGSWDNWKVFLGVDVPR